MSKITLIKSAVQQAAKVLAAQWANVVFYRKPAAGQTPLPTEVESKGTLFGFRRGVVPLPVPIDITRALAEKPSEKEFLIALRKPSLSAVERSLFSSLKDDLALEVAFQQQGIEAFSDFLKILLVPPYGAFGGEPLRFLDPHLGVENISWYLLRSLSFVDSRVYNPNLGNPEGLFSLVSEEFFPIIGFSPLIFQNDLPLVIKIKERSPDSILIAGGIRASTIPPSRFLGSFPFEVQVSGGGEEVISQVAQIFWENRTNFSLPMLSTLPGVNLYFEEKILGGPFRHRSFGRFVQRLDDVPIKAPDVEHRTSYHQAEKKMGLTYMDRIGNRPLIIMLSDRCKKRCIFCGSPKNSFKRGEVREKIRVIKRKFKPPYDSIQIIDNNFSTYRQIVVEFCQAVIAEGLASIPKSGKFRVDEVDPQLLDLLKQAGFTRIFYGVESFSQQTLDFMRKGTTVEQNHQALKWALERGIIPGINLILFGGKDDTPEDILTTIRETLKYVKQGATINVTPFMYAGFGMPILREYPELVYHRDLAIPGLRKPFKEPWLLRLKPPLLDIAKESLVLRSEHLKNIRNGDAQQILTIHESSLILLWAVAKVLGEEKLAEEIEALRLEYSLSQKREVPEI